MIKALNRYLIARRFKAMTRFFDEQIEEARSQHKAIEPIRAAKAEYVHRCLRGIA